jgi:hypothetical protein
MNFTLKVLLASIAFAVALPASAALDRSSTGNSSLILTITDATKTRSATYDLGNLDTFNQLANNSWNLADAALWGGAYSLNSDAAATTWQRFTAGNITPSSTQFAVFGGDSTGEASGDHRLFTTGGIASMINLNNSTLLSGLNNFDSYINAASQLTTHSSVANGSSFATSGTAYGLSASAYSTNGRVGGVGSDANGLMTGNLNVWNFTRNGTGDFDTVSAVKLNNNGFNPYFSLSSDGVLTYTAVNPVPEADSSMMILAGIGLMGLVARRRKAH